MRIRGLVLIACTGLAVAAPGRAQFSLWLPQSVSNGSFVEPFASGESEDFGPEVQRLGWDDRYMREKIGVWSDGYVYHPRFMQYHVSLAGAFDQERYSSNLGGGGNVPYDNKGTGLDYDARFVLLPEHPYNLLLFATRQEPLFRQRSATHHDTVETQYGAEVRYRKEPWTLGSRYSDDTIHSDNSTSNVQRWNTSGQYHRDLAHRGEVSASGAVEPSRFSTDFGLHGTGELGRLASVLDYAYGASSAHTALRSRLDYDNNDQTDPLAGRLQTSELTWEELLEVDLPYHLRADGVWRYRDDSNRSDQFLSGLTELQSTRREYEAGLEHHLYESLVSRYRFRHESTNSTFGDSTAVGNELGFDYIKRVPAGFLLIDSTFGRTDTATSGQVAVAEERHPAVQVPGRFLLANAEVDVTTVTILLRSPLPPFEIVRLEENVHYTLAVVGNQVEVTVFSLPPRFGVPGTYDFIASYLTSGGFTLRTDNLSGSVELHLWNERFFPYYHYSEFKSDVLEGAFTGQALNSTANTLGVELREGSVLLRVEHQQVEWDVGPYTAWLAEFEVYGNFRANTTAHVDLSLLDRYYRAGTSTHTEPYDEFFENAAASVQQRLFDRRMTFSVGGSYSHLVGLSETEAYSVDGSLGWRVGLLDISAGANVSRSRSFGGISLPTRRSADTYWVRVRRDLF